MVHVYPVPDIMEHELEGEECWCEPDIIWKDGETGEVMREPLCVHRPLERCRLIENAELIKNSALSV